MKETQSEPESAEEPPSSPSDGRPKGDGSRPPDRDQSLKHDLRVEEVVQGSHPGDHFIRYRRQSGPFRRMRRNVLAASLETEVPRTSWGRFFNSVKRVLIGKPIS